MGRIAALPGVSYCNRMMTPSTPLRPSPDELAALARQAAGTARIRRIEAAGQFYWVKTEERLGLRMRLQKGDPHRAFAAELAALKTLSAAGLPVAPVVTEGADLFVTADCGPTLLQILRQPDGDAAGRIRAFGAAGAGLARFHARGISHGRPSIRDICWDGAQARFIDFERYAARRNTQAGHAQDLVMLLLTAFTETGAETAETAALAAAYRARDPGGIWDRAARLCRRLRWLDPLTRPLQRRGAREFRAIPLTLRAFGA